MTDSLIYVSGATSFAIIRGSAYDAQGNSAVNLSQNFSIIDATPPIVNILSPESGSVFSIFDTLNIEFELFDNVGLRSIMEYKTNENWVLISDESILNNSVEWDYSK